MRLEAEMRNSNRLNRTIEELSVTKRELMDKIDRMKSDHIEEMRQMIETKPKRFLRHLNLNAVQSVNTIPSVNVIQNADDDQISV